MQSQRICSIPGCGRPYKARGWCIRHWKSWRRHGDPLATTRAKDEMPPQFWARFERQPNGCLNWTGPLRKDGYAWAIGRGAAKGETYLHRVIYRLQVGPIPEGHSVLHRCDNRRCGEPTHLFIGTQADNMADMVAKGRQARFLRGDRCRRGHAYTPENTILRPSKSRNPLPGQMNRWCRTCKNERSREWKREARRRQRVA